MVTRAMLRRGRALAATLVFLACEGSGSGGGGGGLVIENEPIAPNCTPAAGTFPSGLAVLSEASARAVLVQTTPPGLVTYFLNAPRPLTQAFDNIGVDSDSDGVNDATAIAPILGFPLSPVMGEVEALDDALALVSTSNYEQLLAYDPRFPVPVPMVVRTGLAVPASRYPLMPAPGTAALRTGVSTLACVFPPTPIDSQGGAIGPTPICDPTLPSYLTNLTAGKAVAGGRLFVATSNLAPGGGDRFLPGTILVYHWQRSGGSIEVEPDPTTPFLFTTGFNPTGLSRFTTPLGRELVLVTVTGAIGTATGAANVRTEASVDVIDPSIPRIVARIPLGFAGPAFEGPAVDPTGRTAWLGASSQRQLYAVDLRPLDDPNLYLGGPAVALDGLTAGFPDARIFDADRPLVLPDRADGAPPVFCDGFTHVDVNDDGSEAYATDFCDGTFSRVRLDVSGTPPVPFPATRFTIAGQTTPFASNDDLGLLRSPGIVQVRPGTPGVDFTSPDVLVLAGQPDAQICSLRVQSP